MKKGAIIFPAFNEGKVLAGTIASVRQEIKKNSKIHISLIVVDDGSNDNTLQVARKNADIVLHHRRNRGLGGALATGIEYVRRKNIYDFCLTFDSDGQHNPSDIMPAISKLSEGYDVVVGSRFLTSKQQFPKFRKMILKMSNIITYIFFQVWTTDSQSGFRALGQKAIRRLELRTNRMEVSSEFFAEIRAKKLNYSEIPITIKYTQYSLKKGQSNLASMKVLVKLLYRVFH